MYYVLRKDCYIRKIGCYGYINSSGIFNDLLFDKSGQFFLSELSRKPRSLKDITKSISKKFDNVKIVEIEKDVKNFFDALVEDGFAIRGKTIREATVKNVGFSYSNIKQIRLDEDMTPKNIRTGTETQVFLDDYFVKNPYLSSFQIELTSRCNERCIHCYIPHENKISNIQDKLFYKVLNELKALGTLGLTLSGGEPMVHPHFKRFLKKSKSMDFYVHVLSNLTLLDDEIVKIMKEGNVCGIQTSLYSMIPSHHDAITTVKGSFYKTKNAILKLIKNNIPVQINCPVMKINKNDVFDVIKWGHKHKIRVNVDYAIMAEYNHETKNLVNRLTPSECKKVILDIIDADADYKKQILSTDFLKNIKTMKINPNEPFCGVGINTACMVSSGNVYPCPGWQGFVCGNLQKESLESVWFNSKKIKYLRTLKKKDMKKCLNCKNKAFCSPCLGRFANESPKGNPLEIAEHFCKVAAVNKKVCLDFLKRQNDKK